LGAPNRATKVLVLVGMGLGLSFMGGPYFHQFDIRALFTMVETLFVYTGLAAMLHFLLIFPHVRPLMQRTYARKLIYWPALLLWVLLTWNLFFTPPVSSPMTVVVNLATGLIIGLYLLFCLITLLRNFSRTTREERKKLGFNRMMIGTIAALLPVLVANTVSAVSPDLPLPWQEYYFVFLVLIPATWATAAQKLGNG
jgi:Na+/melibiose symporter-like transporter